MYFSVTYVSVTAFIYFYLNMLLFANTQTDAKYMY